MVSLATCEVTVGKYVVFWADGVLSCIFTEKLRFLPHNMEKLWNYMLFVCAILSLLLQKAAGELPPPFPNMLSVIHQLTYIIDDLITTHLPVIHSNFLVCKRTDNVSSVIFEQKKPEWNKSGRNIPVHLFRLVSNSEIIGFKKLI